MDETYLLVAATSVKNNWSDLVFGIHRNSVLLLSQIKFLHGFLEIVAVLPRALSAVHIMRSIREFSMYA